MKKILSVLLAALLLVSCAVPAVANTYVLAGDIDSDGDVTTADARIALRIAIGLDPLNDVILWRADMNDDGRVGTDDARMILRIAIRLEPWKPLSLHTRHVWNDGTVTLAPGCETEGEKIFVCTVCGKSRTEPIPSKGGHQWNIGQITLTPGCITDGEMIVVCAICSETRIVAIPSKGGHQWNDGEISITPSCEKNGVKTFTCIVCGETRTESIPSKGGHQWNDGEITLAPGCETAGEKTFTCTVCGDTRTEAVPAAGHVWELVEVISPATWLKNGTGKFRCSVCGSERNLSIPAVGKDREDDRADRLLAFMKAHGSTEGGVTVYSFTVDDAVYKLSYDEAAPENGFLYTFDFAENVSYGEFGSNTYYSSLSLTLLPPFSAYEGSYRFAVDKLTYLDCTFSIADPAGFRMQNVILGMEITVSKNNVGLSESGVRDEVGAGLQEILYSLEENLKANEADFSVLTDLGFAHLDEWKPL